MRGCVLVACCLFAAPAFAQDVAVRLRWRAPSDASCPTEAQITAGVEERLGRRVFESPAGSAFVIDASVQPVEGDRVSWEAHVALVAPDGERLGERVVMARHPSCEALRGSLGIIISLLVEQHQERIVLYEPAPTPPPPPPPPPEPAAVIQAPSPGPSSEAGPTFGLELGATLRGLALPGPAFGLREVVHLGWQGVPLTLGLEAQVVPPFTYATDAAASELWYWSAGITVCPVLFDDPSVRSVTCAGVLIGQSLARGVELDVARSVEQLRVDVATRLGASIHLAGSLWLTAVAMVDVPLIRQTFTYGPTDAEEVLFEGLPVSLGLGVSLGVFFPES